eukprot:5624840-Amphidinium_carterae.1
MGDFHCKVCSACSHDLWALIEHYTSRHFNHDTHVAMQKKVLNISTHLSSRELGMALEVIEKHGKRLNPRWDYETYRADVMATRGRPEERAPEECSLGAVALLMR